MSAVRTPPAPAPAGRFGGLLRAEAHRFLGRRFIRVLLLLTLVGWITALVVCLLAFRTPTAAELATARQTQQEQIRLSNEGREQCLADAEVPAGVSPEEWCGPVVTEEEMPVSLFLQRPPFSLSEDADDGAIAVAAVGAALAFLVGGTFVGAEWSTRSMVALLFWETRRPRVMAAKLLVTVVAMAVLGLLLQAVWLGVASVLQAVAGNGVAPPGGFWSQLLGTQARAVLLTVFAGLLGFGLTNLLRNTGAAAGAAFVYLLVAENAVRALRPAWQPWLLTTNAGALVAPDGLTLEWTEQGLDGQGTPTTATVQHLLGSGQATVYLAVVTAVVVGAGVVLFSRRDLH
jgi:hypothetical protein